MMSMQSNDEVTVTFSCPTVAPRNYVTRGPSGWPETFKRDAADHELAKFIAPVDIDALVDVFVLRRETADKKESTDWHTVIGFLSRTMGVSPRMIPPIVGVAFWGRVVTATTSAQGN